MQKKSLIKNRTAVKKALVASKKLSKDEIASKATVGSVGRIGNSGGVGNGAGVGQPGARPESHAGGEPGLGRSCAASGRRDQLIGAVGKPPVPDRATLFPAGLRLPLRG